MAVYSRLPSGGSKPTIPELIYGGNTNRIADLPIEPGVYLLETTAISYSTAVAPHHIQSYTFRFKTDGTTITDISYNTAYHTYFNGSYESVSQKFVDGKYNDLFSITGGKFSYSMGGRSTANDSNASAYWVRLFKVG